MCNNNLNKTSKAYGPIEMAFGLISILELQKNKPFNCENELLL